jgi:hypothetical protein
MKDHQKKVCLLAAVPAVLMLVFGSTSLVAAEDGQATLVAPLSRSRYTPFGTDGTSAVAETQVRMVDVQFGRKPKLLRRVWRRSGAQRVRFQYAPTSLKLGLYASLTASVAIVLLALYRLRSGSNR